MRHSRVLVLSVVGAAWLAACGGSNGGGTTPPPPNPPPPPQQNPCEGIDLEALAAPDNPPSFKNRERGPEPGRWGVLTEIWKHRAAVQRSVEAGVSPQSTTKDVGEINVLTDEGDLVIRPNAFDLTGKGLRFTRNATGGYDVVDIDAGFRTTLGNQLSLRDDDSFGTTMPFTFSLYGRNQSRVFVNTDGNITFEEEDRASSARDVARLLTGPPRVAPFLADLDPTAGGRVFLQSAADQFTVTWCGVRGFDSPNRTTVQVSLLPSGTVEMKYGDTITLRDAVVGVSPGRTGEFEAVDLTTSGQIAGGSAAVGERFAQDFELDLVAVANAFYASHPDNFDQLVIYTDTRVAGGGTFAFEVTVSNEIRGIGLDIFNASREFGSAGRLRSIVMMDVITKYPDNPSQKFLGEDSSLSVLGQESGHRWLAFMRFRDHTGRTSDALLGRDQAHWSFFLDSDASVMEGNDIDDLGGGEFKTIGAVQRYSRLDQYAMGLLRESEVPAFFYVEAPTNVQPPQDPISSPRVGVTFNGTKRTVLIQDVVAVLGARQPAAGSGSRVHRQAFLFVVGLGHSLNPAHVSKVDRIRTDWAGFFARATSNRSRAETRLRPPS